VIAITGHRSTRRGTAADRPPRSGGRRDRRARGGGRLEPPHPRALQKVGDRPAHAATKPCSGPTPSTIWSCSPIAPTTCPWSALPQAGAARDEPLKRPARAPRARTREEGSRRSFCSSCVSGPIPGRRAGCRPGPPALARGHVCAGGRRSWSRRHRHAPRYRTARVRSRSSGGGPGRPSRSGDPYYRPTVRFNARRTFGVTTFEPERSLGDHRSSWNRRSEGPEKLPDGRVQRDARPARGALRDRQDPESLRSRPSTWTRGGRQGKVATAPVPISVTTVLAEGDARPADIKSPAVMPTRPSGRGWQGWRSLRPPWRSGSGRGCGRDPWRRGSGPCRSAAPGPTGTAYAELERLPVLRVCWRRGRVKQFLHRAGGDPPALPHRPIRRGRHSSAPPPKILDRPARRPPAVRRAWRRPPYFFAPVTMRSNVLRS